jgi:DNA-binding transcriptional LysR family regulator
MNRMTLDQLRVFVAVAERQHVTKAAEVLNLAQSAVSTAVATLEDRHGTKLFHRIGRGIELTLAGSLFLSEARAVLARVASAELALAELAELKRGTLTVQASHTIASYWLPRHLAGFRRAHPGIDIRLIIGNTACVANGVRDGVTELGFVEGCVEDPVLTSIPVARDQVVIVVGPEHPWADDRDLTPKDLPQTEWVMREPGSGTRSVFEQALCGFGMSMSNLRIALELPSNEAIRAAVEAGMGAAAVSASVAAPSVEAGLLHCARLPLPERNFYALYHTERWRSHAVNTLLDMVAGRQVHGRDASVGGRSGAINLLGR